MLVPVGPLEELPADRGVGVGGGAAVVVRDGDDVVAFVDRCRHEQRSLAGGLVRDGVLTCPHHCWPYRIADGRHASGGQLERLPARTIDGQVLVEVPDPRPSMRDVLLEHARTWTREQPHAT